MLVINEVADALSKSDTPIIKPIYDRAGNRLLVIGLRSGVTFPEHLAPSQAKLMVVQGEIDFKTATNTYRFERFDSFDIPMDVKHSVLGVFDAIFLLLLGAPKDI
ncbi:MAG: quercetin dioxygenase-like cupin family protein [Flavobacteriales bacterium]|jgi:quercetin dioxygenase-like cupin family protein